MELTVITTLTLNPYDQKVVFAWDRPKSQTGKKAWVDRYGKINLYVGSLILDNKIKISDEQYKAWVKQMKFHKTDVFYWEEEGCFVTYSNGYVAEIKNFESLIASVTISK